MIKWIILDIDLLQRNIALIRSDLLLEKDFIEFICSLISYIPQHRPTFEEIYRNKWLYKNKNLISDINHIFTEGDEDKLLRELLKSDFLMNIKIVKSLNLNFWEKISFNIILIIPK